MKKVIYCFSQLLLIHSGYAQIGYGTASPNSGLDVRGAMSVSLRSFAGNTTISITDYALVFTGASAATATLPDAATCAGRVYWIKNAGTGAPIPVLTVASVAAQTMDGAGSWILDEPNEAIRIMSNGAGWYVASQAVPVIVTAATGAAWLEGGNKLKTPKAVGTGTATDFALMTNNAEGMRITAAGNFGMGTNNPLGGLHFVSDNNNAGGDGYYFDDYMNGTNTLTAGIFLRKSRGTTASPLDLQNGDIISQFRFAPRFSGALTKTNGSGIDAFYLGSGITDTTDMRWFASGTELMRIHQWGYVGIGTSSFNTANPEQLLVDAGTSGSFNVISGKGIIDNYLQLNIQNKSNGGNSSSDIVATSDNGDETGIYIDMGINGGGYSNTSVPILGSTDKAYLYTTGGDFVIGNSTSGQNLVFFNNGIANSNEALRITAAGNTGIGISTPADILSVAGILSPSADNSYTLGSAANRWSVVWATNGVIQTSDARLKTNIEPLEYSTAELMQLNPVTYQWKKTVNGKREIGLIAQQIRKIIPEVVTGNEKTEHLGMNYAELVVVLINAIKEQQSRLAVLAKELETLKRYSQ